MEGRARAGTLAPKRQPVDFGLGTEPFRREHRTNKRRTPSRVETFDPFEASGGSQQKTPRPTARRAEARFGQESSCADLDFGLGGESSRTQEKKRREAVETIEITRSFERGGCPGLAGGETPLARGEPVHRDAVGVLGRAKGGGSGSGVGLSLKGRPARVVGREPGVESEGGLQLGGGVSGGKRSLGLES